jgi:beta-phosphoglucomutase-like phosphatase (HAD superfamily)
LFKAVIFDMDGVIIDSEPMHARANVLALKRYNIEVPLSYCYPFIGSTTYHMCQKMVEDFNMKASPEELLKANDEMKDYLLKTEGHTVIPYIIDLIKDLNR